MRRSSLVLVLLTVALATACTPQHPRPAPGPGWNTHTIARGPRRDRAAGRRAPPPLLGFTRQSGRTYHLIFDASARYVLTNPTEPEDQLDWNKLPGLSDCAPNYDLAVDGLMFGWRWRTDLTPRVLEVTAYANDARRAPLARGAAADADPGPGRRPACRSGSACASATTASATSSRCGTVSAGQEVVRSATPRPPLPGPGPGRQQVGRRLLLRRHQRRPAAHPGLGPRASLRKSTAAQLEATPPGNPGAAPATALR